MTKKTHNSLTIKQLAQELKDEIKACKKDIEDLPSNESFDRGFIRGCEVALSYLK
jgi:hypothetical protein